MCFNYMEFFPGFLNFETHPYEKIMISLDFPGNSAARSPPRHPISHAAWTHDLAERTAIAIIAHDAKKQKQGAIFLFFK